MDPRLLRYYNSELQYIREAAAEFAREFPKIGGRLGLDGIECADPYVERLLEGFAFLAARVQLRIDAEFPRFTQHLLEMVYPHYLVPTPSMAVVQFQPDLAEGALAEGFTIARDSALRSLLGASEQTPCEYRTAHDVTLWPLELTAADYFSRETAPVDLPDVPEAKAALQLRLKTTAGLTFDQLPLASLPLYLRGAGEMPMHLCEQLLANAVGVAVRPADSAGSWSPLLGAGHVRRMGFNDDQSLLPCGPRSFQGYRLLQEYFAFPQRFLFAELVDIGQALRQHGGETLDVVVLLDRSHPALEDRVDASNFALFCTPAINLFPKRTDRVHVTERTAEHHVVPDRTRPMDFEVYQVHTVTGHFAASDDEQPFLPFYALTADSDGDQMAYYVVHRKPRVLSQQQRHFGPRSSYIGSEVFLSLVDGHQAPYRHDLRQLSLETLCTNRDLPLHMPVGAGETDFTLESGAPVRAIRCITGPSKPRPSVVHSEGESAWRLISHLSLNYLSLVDSDSGQGAAGLRSLLKLYGDISDAATRKQIEGIKSVTSSPITRPLPTDGPLAFGRGLELRVTLDESAFEGTGMFLLGAVLEQFFAKYVSINSFTETVVETVDRGQIVRWPTRFGRRHVL